MWSRSLSVARDRASRIADRSRPLRHPSFRRRALGNADPRRWPMPRVVPRACRIHLGEVGAGPANETADELAQGRAEWRERILDARRHFRIDRPLHETVAL